LLLPWLQASGLEPLLAEMAVQLQVVLEQVAPHLEPLVRQVCGA
jgi:hypothetical protein